MSLQAALVDVWGAPCFADAALNAARIWCSQVNAMLSKDLADAVSTIAAKSREISELHATVEKWKEEHESYQDRLSGLGALTARSAHASNQSTALKVNAQALAQEHRQRLDCLAEAHRSSDNASDE